jgi:hypothetical protein
MHPDMLEVVDEDVTDVTYPDVTDVTYPDVTDVTYPDVTDVTYPDVTYINDVWTLYFHASDDPDWTLSSYVRLTDISTVEDFWASSSCLTPHVAENMFFLMREGVYPCWDDPQNMYGGCVSMKVSKMDAPRAWEDVCSRVLGETIASDRTAWELVNGVSISPKRYFSIIKVWLKDSERFTQSTDFDLPSWYNGEVLFRNHMDCIKANTEKLLRSCNGHATMSLTDLNTPHTTDGVE